MGTVGKDYFVKYVRQDPTLVMLDKITYRPWQGRLPDDTGCGKLIHEVKVYTKPESMSETPELVSD